MKDSDGSHACSRAIDLIAVRAEDIPAQRIPARVERKTPRLYNIGRGRSSRTAFPWRFPFCEGRTQDTAGKLDGLSEALYNGVVGQDFSAAAAFETPETTAW
jgi:hypothetical protein